MKILKELGFEEEELKGWEAKEAGRLNGRRKTQIGD